MDCSVLLTEPVSGSFLSLRVTEVISHEGKTLYPSYEVPLPKEAIAVTKLASNYCLAVDPLFLERFAQRKQKLGLDDVLLYLKVRN